ncbi:hypothetical protein WA026_000948 [Henosepilachna vigintioctopunctata]|uniref:TAF6 C-terminal HEAT repeat domain-containing protein n=1 Tax=Henosepilachna vigintioctopunctata TaxID=420089 RepID=A0AAW1V8U7_9CUCU
MNEESNQKIDRKLSFPKISYPENNPETHIPNILKSLHIKSDHVFLKFQPDAHALSVEEQLFFINITEGVFGYNEQIRNETLKLLTSDYNVRYLAPNITEFIKQSIHLNLVFVDLTLLIYAVRMTKNMIANPHVEVGLYLHTLIPAVLSCALAKRISKYYYDNHWTLRDFSAYVIATICHKHGNEINRIKERVINIYLKPMVDTSMSLTTLYGAIKGLASLGEDTIKSCIIPNLYGLGKRIYKILENRSNKLEDKQQILEAKHVRDLVVNIASPVLFKTENLLDDGNEYIQKFGYFGYLIFMHIKKIEKLES